jgi:uncharacterized surface protein with fasciclin (FAS1) repeats
MTKLIGAWVLSSACSGAAPTTASKSLVMATAPVPAAAVVAPAKADHEKTVVDIAVGSPDHTTLVAAVDAAGLVPALSSPGGIYTVLAPTNDAFAELPKATLDDLMKPEHKADLKRILQHHAGVPIVQTKDMLDGQSMTMSDGTKVTFHVQGDKVMVEGATILGSITGANGVVHVIDKVLVPPAK